MVRITKENLIMREEDWDDLGEPLKTLKPNK